MKFTRIYTGPDEQSYFEEGVHTLENAPIGKITAPIGVENILFGELDEDIKEIGWHNPPVPQYVIMLEGSMEIEIGDGTKRVFNVGDIVLAEDTTGQGHNTRGSKGKNKYLVMPLK